MIRLSESLKKGGNYVIELLDYMTAIAPVEQSRLEKIWGSSNNKLIRLETSLTQEI